MTGGGPKIPSAHLRYKHLTIEAVPMAPGRWSVWNHHYGEKLGEIRWYAPWRQYCFVTEEQAYSLGCLKDIAEAMDTIKGEGKRLEDAEGGSKGVSRPLFCPNCGHRLPEGPNGAQAVADGWDCFCPGCQWSGDILPDGEEGGNK